MWYISSFFRLASVYIQTEWCDGSIFMRLFSACVSESISRLYATKNYCNIAFIDTTWNKTISKYHWIHLSWARWHAEINISGHVFPPTQPPTRHFDSASFACICRIWAVGCLNWEYIPVLGDLNCVFFLSILFRRHRILVELTHHTRMLKFTFIPFENGRTGQHLIDAENAKRKKTRNTT